MNDKWIAFPDNLAIECAHKPYIDAEGLEKRDNTFLRGEFNGHITFVKVKDLEQVIFDGWCQIDGIVINGLLIKYFIYCGKRGYAWKRIDEYSAKSLNELFRKMNNDGALFNSPTMVFE